LFCEVDTHLVTFLHEQRHSKKSCIGGHRKVRRRQSHPEEPTRAGEPETAILSESLQASECRSHSGTRRPGPVHVVVKPDPLVKAVKASPVLLRLDDGGGFVRYPIATSRGVRNKPVAESREPLSEPGRCAHGPQTCTRLMQDR
jgi:hypothetical protein